MHAAGEAAISKFGASAVTDVPEVSSNTWAADIQGCSSTSSDSSSSGSGAPPPGSASAQLLHASPGMAADAHLGHLDNQFGDAESDAKSDNSSSGSNSSSSNSSSSSSGSSSSSDESDSDAGSSRHSSGSQTPTVKVHGQPLLASIFSSADSVDCISETDVDADSDDMGQGRTDTHSTGGKGRSDDSERGDSDSSSYKSSDAKGSPGADLDSDARPHAGHAQSGHSDPCSQPTVTGMSQLCSFALIVNDLISVKMGVSICSQLVCVVCVLLQYKSSLVTPGQQTSATVYMVRRILLHALCLC